MAMRAMMGRTDNRKAAEQFYDLALAMEIQGERWRANSYLKAARSIEAQAESVRSLAERSELRTIEGVGESIEAKLDEYISTGRIEALDAVRELLPEDLALLREIPSLGIRRVADLDRLLGIRTVDELLRALYENRLSDLPEFGEEVERRTMEWLVWKREEAAEIPTPYALRSAHQIITFLRSGGDVARMEVSGPARRGATAVANITILFTSPHPDLVIARFGICPEVTELTVVEKEQAIGKTWSGAACMVRAVDEDLFAWELLRTTGSETYIRELDAAGRMKGRRPTSSSLRGIASEEGIHEHLGAPYMGLLMREGREGRGEETLTAGALHGDLHVRSATFDGPPRVTEMAHAAHQIGHHLICFCDRVGGRYMDPDAFDRRNSLIDEAVDLVGITLLKGAEVDITPDGRLDSPPDILEDLDLVIASVNTKLDMAPREMEERIIRAMDDPNMDVLGHPTNRIIGLREKSGADLARIATRAAERRVALEVNAYPDRMDLADNDAYKVYDEGAFYCLGTDSAFPNEMDYWQWAVTIGRKAMLTPRRVLNAFDPARLRKRAWRK